jgi:uncharacterized membrane protein YhiD involved in acid resistance
MTFEEYRATTPAIWFFTASAWMSAAISGFNIGSDHIVFAASFAMTVFFTIAHVGFRNYRRRIEKAFAEAEEQP